MGIDWKIQERRIEKCDAMTYSAVTTLLQYLDTTVRSQWLRARHDTLRTMHHTSATGKAGELRVRGRVNATVIKRHD